jgi:SHS2 domain-containing protein
MIIKFNCSINEFNELYTERNEEVFEEKIVSIFDTIETNDNLEIDESNYLEFNTPDSFYISIKDLEKVLKDIHVKNKLLNDFIIVDLLEHCHNIYGINNLVKNLELV